MKSASIGSAAAVLLSLAGTIDVPAQTRPVVAPAEYGRWETLQLPNTGGLSPDGRWVAYGINRSNRSNELRITSVGDGKTTAVAFGAQPAISADSQWAAYAIGISEAQEDTLRSEKKPIRKKVGILNLKGGTSAVVDDVESFAFDASGSHLAMRRYPPEPDKKPSNDAAPAPETDAVAGATLVVRHLATGRDGTCLRRGTSRAGASFSSENSSRSR